MALMTWSPALSVKVKKFDEQHMKLVDIVNHLHDAMRERQGLQVLGSIFDKLLAYTATHFADEERLMTQHGYPGLARHKAEHAELVKTATELQAKFKAGSTTLTLDVMNFLKEWLAKHIQGEDRKYGDYFESKGIKL